MTECGLPNLSEVHGLPVLESTPDELEQYDLVIDGTGLTAAIVACAASRSGKSVLHIDSNNYYGGSSGSFPLEDFQIWCRAAISETLLSETFTANKAIEESFDSTGKQLPIYFGTPLLRVIGFQENGDQSLDNSMSRKFTVDLSSKLVYSAGNVVTILINAGVSDYLEFKAVEKLYYRGESDGCIHPVPCSKNEVFKDKLLGPLEKRYLTKFLQFTSDWGRVNIAGHELTTLNERALATGGSLHRPQNKNQRAPGECPSSSSSPALGHIQSQTAFSIRGFEDHLFTTFMTMNSLGPKLQRIITHALCLHSEAVGGDTDMLLTFPGMLMLYRHISALGIFGTTALLHPLYGVGELPQAFCRMCAVWGGIYMLRQSMQSVTISRIPVERKVSPLEERSPSGINSKEQIAATSILVESNTLSDGNVDMNMSVYVESSQVTSACVVNGGVERARFLNTELREEMRKIDEDEDEDEVAVEVEVLYATTPLNRLGEINDINEINETKEMDTTLPARALQHKITVTFQEDTKANIRSDSSSGLSAEYDRKTVNCSALLLSAEKVILPSTLLRAALVTRVIIFRDNKTESSSIGIEALDDVVGSKSRTVTVFPPNSPDFENNNAIYAVHLDSSSCVCPDGFFLVYLTTEILIPITVAESLGEAVERDVAVFWDAFVKTHQEEANAQLNRVASYLIKSFGEIILLPPPCPPPPLSPPSSSTTLSHPEIEVSAACQDSDSPSTDILTPDLLPLISDQTLPLPLPLQSAPPLPPSLPLGHHSTAPSPSSTPSSPVIIDQLPAVVDVLVPRVTMLLSATTMRPLYESAALGERSEEMRQCCQANIALCGGTTSSLTMEEEVAQAESIFNYLFPDSIFLPPKLTEKEEEEEEEERERGEA